MCRHTSDSNGADCKVVYFYIFVGYENIFLSCAGGIR